VAEKLLAEGGWISVQVLNEFVAVARRKLNMSWEKTREALLAIRALCESPTTLSIETHEAALEIAARYGYSIYDALILLQLWKRTATPFTPKICRTIKSLAH
jgi:predicted nucleic acid-binding protein